MLSQRSMGSGGSQVRRFWKTFEISKTALKITFTELLKPFESSEELSVSQYNADEH